MKRSLFFVILISHSPPIFSYIGPGSGLSAIGSLVAVLGTLFLLIAGFLWYPLKRLFFARKKKNIKEKDEDNERNDDEDIDKQD